jgi:dTDP-4-dehydrorhamnose reductase
MSSAPLASPAPLTPPSRTPRTPIRRRSTRTGAASSSERDTLDVVDDQVGQPTWSLALARRLSALGDAALAGRAAPGAYHATASGQTSWYGLARAVFVEAGLDPDRIRPTTSAAYPRPARRAAFSVLGDARGAAAGLTPMTHWRAMLTEAFGRLRLSVR